MHCREKTSFNPAEPKYHRLLIDLLVRAQKYAAVQLKNEEPEQEKSVGEQLDSGRAKSIKREADAVDDDEDEGEQLNACMKNESDAVDNEEKREVKRPKCLSPSSPLLKAKEEPIEWDDQYDPRPLLESAFTTNETSQLAVAADSTNDQLDHCMSAVHPGDYVDVAAEDDKIKLPRTDRIPAAPITTTEDSEATMSSKREEEEGTLTVTNVASKKWNQKKRLQEKIIKLQNADADKFCYELIDVGCLPEVR